jgi:hypothetical protein
VGDPALVPDSSSLKNEKNISPKLYEFFNKNLDIEEENSHASKIKVSSDLDIHSRCPLVPKFLEYQVVARSEEGMAWEISYLERKSPEHVGPGPKHPHPPKTKEIIGWKFALYKFVMQCLVLLQTFQCCRIHVHCSMFIDPPPEPGMLDCTTYSKFLVLILNIRVLIISVTCSD